MPEGDYQDPQTDPTQNGAEAQPQQPEHVPPAGAEPQQPVQPPDIGEAISQMREQMSRMEERIGGEPEPPADPYERLLGEPEYEEPAQPPAQPQQPYQDPYYQQPDPQQQQYDQLNQLVEQRAREIVRQEIQPPHEDRRRDQIHQLVERYNHPEHGFMAKLDAVDAQLRQYAQQFHPDDREAVQTDPKLVEAFYLAELARGTDGPAAQQTSPGPEGSAGGPAEAGSQQGVHLETGAGARPGEPPPEDPQEQAVMKALRHGEPMQDEDLYA